MTRATLRPDEAGAARADASIDAVALVAARLERLLGERAELALARGSSLALGAALPESEAAVIAQHGRELHAFGARRARDLGTGKVVRGNYVAFACGRTLRAGSVARVFAAHSVDAVTCAARCRVGARRAGSEPVRIG